MQREPNVRLAEAIRRAGFSNTSAAARVRGVAQENRVDLRCTHVDVRRWLDGVAPRPATGQFIATAISRKIGKPLSLQDIGMGDASPDTALENGLDYVGDGWAAGQRISDLTRRELVEDALFLGAAIVPAAWSQPMLTWLLSRTEPLRTKDSTRIAVGESDVKAIQTTIQLFMKLDFQFGGGHARAALAQYYSRDVRPLLQGTYTERVGRQLFSAAAEVSQLLGWTAYDMGRHGIAQRYLIQALRLAQEAGDRMMGGRLLSNMSHQATYLGNFDYAVQLARAAQEGTRGRASATTMAMFLAMEARAHAGNGDDAGCSRALAHAEQVFDKSPGADDPQWISYFDAAELAGEGAHCFRDLRNPRITQELVSRAIELTGSEYVRTLAFVRLVHAASFAQQGEPGRAAQIATETIGVVGNLKSQRYLRYINDLSADLDIYAGDTDVRVFKRLIAERYPRQELERSPIMRRALIAKRCKPLLKIDSYAISFTRSPHRPCRHSQLVNRATLRHLVGRACIASESCRRHGQRPLERAVSAAHRPHGRAAPRWSRIIVILYSASALYMRELNYGRDPQNGLSGRYTWTLGAEHRLPVYLDDPMDEAGMVGDRKPDYYKVSRELIVNTVLTRCKVAGVEAEREAS